MKPRNFSSIITALFFVLTFQYNCAQNNTEADEMLQLVNNFRAENGLPPLRLNKNLNKAALDHSIDMGENNYFSHTGRNGSSFGQRVKKTGYTGFAYGENIAVGSATVKRVFDLWKNSSGHRKNILNKKSNEMGIGHASVTGADYNHYWTQIFGKGDKTLTIGNEISRSASNFFTYPNPVDDIVHIQLQNRDQKPLELTLTTTTGQLVFEQKIVHSGNDYSIDIAHLPKGTYFLKTSANSPAIKIAKN